MDKPASIVTVNTHIMPPAIANFIGLNNDNIPITSAILFIADPMAFIINDMAKILFGSILVSPNFANRITKAPIKIVKPATTLIAVATAPGLFTASIIAIKAPMANKTLLIIVPNDDNNSAIAANL